MSEKLALAPDCPFKVGDLIHEWDSQHSWSADGGQTWQTSERVLNDRHPDAVVTELTPRGFKYQYTERVPFIAREGSWFEGGECFPSGYHCWTLIETAKIQRFLPPHIETADEVIDHLRRELHRSLSAPPDFFRAMVAAAAEHHARTR